MILKGLSPGWVPEWSEDKKEVKSQSPQHSANCILAGQILIVPTDTVYGLCCKYNDISLLYRVSEIKRRPADQPFQLLLASPAYAERFALDIPEVARHLIDRFWPGGMTLLLRARPGLPDPLVGPSGTVGLRVPDMEDLQKMIELAGGGIAATSANLSGGRDPHSVEEIPAAIREAVGFVWDIGPLAPKPASTIIDCCGEQPRIVRQGTLSIEVLQPYLAP